MWREYFKPPFKRDFSIVWDSEYNRAFDFLIEESEEMDRIIAVLNGESEKRIIGDNMMTEEGDVFLNGHAILMIRSWGRLTGKLLIDSETACKIQDEFAQWIIDTLTKKP